MSVTRQQFLEQFALLPSPPFLARLLDPYVRLTQLERARYRFTTNNQLFTVVEAVLDRCLEQPGIWVRAVPSLQLVHVSTATNGRRQQRKCYAYKSEEDRSIWLNMDWCQLYLGSSVN